MPGPFVVSGAEKKLQDRLPIRTRNKRMVSMVRLAALVQHAGRVFLTRRPPGSKLADFWQLPGIEWVDKAGKTNRNGSVAHASRLRLALEKKYCLRTGALRWRCRWDYTITKYAMRLEVFDTELAGDLILTDSTAKQVDSPRQSRRWFFSRDLKKLPLPSADRRVMEEPV